LVFLCWLGSIAVAILVTMQVVRPPATLAGEAPTRAPLSASAPASASRFKLVVRSEPRATPDARQAMALERDRLNDVMRRNANRGWKPLFEVEDGVNGALSLVFAAQGTEQGQWVDFFNLLTKQRQYAGARWVEIR
jgi:hypothetical protein